MHIHSSYFYSSGENSNVESCSRLLVEALCESVTVTQTDSELPFSIQMVTVDESEYFCQIRLHLFNILDTLNDDLISQVKIYQELDPRVY